MRVYVCVCSCVIAVALLASEARGGTAEPTAACRSLASRFETAVAQLDAKSLVDLGTCVAVELGKRAGAEPLAAESSSSPPPRQYGEWPPSAPWMADWPPTGPWERP